MAFLRMVAKSFETAGHGIATGATALADEVTGKQHPELRKARADQEERMRMAARETEVNARVVGDHLKPVVDTTGASLSVLLQLIKHKDQGERLGELITKHDFRALVEALTGSGGAAKNLKPDFFPTWMRTAGGYFPKFAQVLSVRADLIRDERVLQQLARCLEDMPPRDEEAVRNHLAALPGLPQQAAVCAGLGAALNAGTIAQVNLVRLPVEGGVESGELAVVKVCWEETRRKMLTDFRLFSHAKSILKALHRESDPNVQIVEAMFAAVGKAEPHVIAEFDLLREASALKAAGRLCAPNGEWSIACNQWMDDAEAKADLLPPHLLGVTRGVFPILRQCEIRVPQPFDAYCARSALFMERAGGESVKRLLEGQAQSPAHTQAAGILITLAMPFVGWLLLVKSSSDPAHVDPHLGNFRWDAEEKVLWVLDWGSHVTLPTARR
ncbi:hypothetical protein CYMTET_56785 [Cymbomonas tetramitiformis]|uniref:ABC1 atypical kinase-like domain-containing protein n=1 Tax=Cymbomonas tetramitiformis TaxID=36881 RepID=A0AAE0BBM1_9CHLO|nr:hypothetical protein CYMTET_56785 [Cymbomonas tetramitiformis]